MVKAIEVIVVIILLIFSFCIGVKYSDSVKNHASWLFEAKEEEVELPDLSNEGAVDGAVDQNGENLEGGVMIAPQETAPMDNLNTNEQPQAAPTIRQ